MITIHQWTLVGAPVEFKRQRDGFNSARFVISVYLADQFIEDVVVLGEQYVHAKETELVNKWKRIVDVLGAKNAHR